MTNTKNDGAPTERAIRPRTDVFETEQEIELVLELAFDSRAERVAVAAAGALIGELAQTADRRRAGRQRILGEAVAEVLESELALRGDLTGVAHRFGKIAEQLRHLGGRLEMVLAILE